MKNLKVNRFQYEIELNAPTLSSLQKPTNNNDNKKNKTPNFGHTGKTNE